MQWKTRNKATNKNKNVKPTAVWILWNVSTWKIHGWQYEFVITSWPFLERWHCWLASHHFVTIAFRARRNNYFINTFSSGEKCLRLFPLIWYFLFLCTLNDIIQPIVTVWYRIWNCIFTQRFFRLTRFVCCPNRRWLGSLYVWMQFSSPYSGR